MMYFFNIQGTFGCFLWLRQEMIDSIEDFCSFFTIVKTTNSYFKLGDKVEVVTINLTKYIRTDGNRTESDNLGELDTF